jgi:hypothetical protein
MLRTPLALLLQQADDFTASSGRLESRLTAPSASPGCRRAGWRSRSNLEPPRPLVADLLDGIVECQHEAEPSLPSLIEVLCCANGTGLKDDPDRDVQMERFLTRESRSTRRHGAMTVVRLDLPDFVIDEIAEPAAALVLDRLEWFALDLLW